MKLTKTKKVFIIIITSVIGILIILNLFFMLAPQFGRKPNKDRMAELAKKSHYQKGKFSNSEKVHVMLPGSYGKLIKTARQSKEGRTPEMPIPSDKPVFSASSDSLSSVIWLGHSSALISLSGKIILTDPVFSKRASPVNFAGPKPFPLEHAFTPDELPYPDIILISHDHFDHLDYRTIKDYYLDVAHYVVPLGVRDHLEKWGVKPAQIIELDWWEEELILEDIRIAATPAQHFSGRQKQNFSTLWCSFVIQSSKEKIFFSGDSGYAGHFKEIGDKYGPFDLALIECGAYGKYWPKIHMVPEESVQAALDVQAKLALPIHWSRFNLAFHPWTESVERFMRMADANNLSYATPRIGQEIQLGNNLSTDSWWK